MGVVGRTHELEPVVAHLVDRYESLRRFAAIVADSDMDPDEVAHEAMTRVLLAVRRGRGPGASAGEVERYTRRAIVSVCSNSRRRFARRATAMGRIGRSDTTVLPLYPSEMTVLDGLAPRERAVLYLQHVEGRTSDEIGSLLDLSSAAVRQTAARARRRIRLEVEPEPLIAEEGR
jgi:DNA-directed RNA polymerase specialized sigma24 family protein